MCSRPWCCIPGPTWSHAHWEYGCEKLDSRSLTALSCSKPGGERYIMNDYHEVIIPTESMINMGLFEQNWHLIGFISPGKVTHYSITANIWVCRANIPVELSTDSLSSFLKAELMIIIYISGYPWYFECAQPRRSKSQTWTLSSDSGPSWECSFCSSLSAPSCLHQKVSPSAHVIQGELEGERNRVKHLKDMELFCMHRTSFFLPAQPK